VSAYLALSQPGWGTRAGYRVVSMPDGWLLSEHASRDEAESRCDRANINGGHWVVTDDVGKVLYGRL
jgi:hypothetical protein